MTEIPEGLSTRTPSPAGAFLEPWALAPPLNLATPAVGRQSAAGRGEMGPRARADRCPGSYGTSNQTAPGSPVSLGGRGQ